MAQFDGQVLIVTGGASGIGEAVARAFVKRGGRVVLADIDVGLGATLEAQIGRAVLFHKADVRDRAQCQATVARAVAAFGRVDCLVNSAIKMAPGPLADLALEDHSKQRQVDRMGRTTSGGRRSGKNIRSALNPS